MAFYSDFVDKWCNANGVVLLPVVRARSIVAARRARAGAAPPRGRGRSRERVRFALGARAGGNEPLGAPCDATRSAPEALSAYRLWATAQGEGLRTRVAHWVTESQKQRDSDAAEAFGNEGPGAARRGSVGAAAEAVDLGGRGWLGADSTYFAHRLAYVAKPCAATPATLGCGRRRQ